MLRNTALQQSCRLLRAQSVYGMIFQDIDRMFVHQYPYLSCADCKASLAVVSNLIGVLLVLQVKPMLAEALQQSSQLA